MIQKINQLPVKQLYKWDSMVYESRRLIISTEVNPSASAV
jgi:hypothetical protein